MTLDTIKDFLDISVNPRKVAEREKLWEDFRSGAWFDKADMLTSDSNIRQVLYGAPYFSWLNYHSDLWRLLPKKPAGEPTFLPSGSGNSYSGATAVNIYPWGRNLARVSASGAGYGNHVYDAVVDDNAGVLRSFDLDLLDGVIRQVRLNGANMANFVILTGADTADLLSKKIESKQRITDVARVTVGVNGVTRTSDVGVAGGFDVLTYKGIPILESKSIYRNRASEGLANPANGYSRIYGINLDDAYISVGLPTVYFETDRSHWLLLNKLRKKALFVTAAELVFRRWNTSFKIRDITA